MALEVIADTVGFVKEHPKIAAGLAVGVIGIMLIARHGKNQNSNLPFAQQMALARQASNAQLAQIRAQEAPQIAATRASVAEANATTRASVAQANIAAQSNNVTARLAAQSQIIGERLQAALAEVLGKYQTQVELYQTKASNITARDIAAYQSQAYQAQASAQSDSGIFSALGGAGILGALAFL
jgi:hypothetical protein